MAINSCVRCSHKEGTEGNSATLEESNHDLLGRHNKLALSSESIADTAVAKVLGVSAWMATLSAGASAIVDFFCEWYSRKCARSFPGRVAPVFVDVARVSNLVDSRF